MSTINETSQSRLSEMYTSGPTTLDHYSGTTLETTLEHPTLHYSGTSYLTGLNTQNTHSGTPYFTFMVELVPYSQSPTTLNPPKMECLT